MPGTVPVQPAGEGRIAEDELASVLRSKLEDSVHDLFTWTAGTFQWQESETAPTVPARLDLEWRDALLSVQRHDGPLIEPQRPVVSLTLGRSLLDQREPVDTQIE